MGGGKGGGGGAASTINVNNSGTTTVDSNSVIDVLGLDNINSKTELILPQPLRTENSSRTELAITQPIVTDSTSDLSLDIKPLTVDLCLNINYGGIPPTCIRLPYQQHFGITLFGVEILGFNIAGESRVVIEDLLNRPQVAWEGEQAAVHPLSRQARTQREPGGGLRIRLDT